MSEVTGESWFWVTFEDMSKRKGKRFVGNAILRGKDRGHLMARMKVLNIMPTNIKSMRAIARPIPPEYENRIPSEMTYRLLNWNESIVAGNAFGGGMTVI